LDAAKNAAIKPRPVMIVGTAPRVALAVARSLARRGIDVLSAPSSDDEGRIPSNAFAGYVHLPDARTHPDEFDEGLEAAVKRSGVDMLVPCSDKALAAIARNYASLRTLAHPGCPPPDIVARVLEKNSTLDAARSLGLDMPATYDLQNRDSYASTRSTLAFPLVAKPKNHSGRGGVRIRYIADAAALEALIREEPQFSATYLVQQFVAGSGVGVAVLMQDGVPKATFVHRRVKELPAAGGVSVVSEGIPPEPALVEKAVALLRAVAWEGVAFVEFRRAPDGTDWLMEINGRYWGTLSTAIAAGVDFPYYQWQSVHGIALEPERSYATGVRVRWTRGAILRLRERLFERPGFGTVRRDSREELRSFWSDFSPPVKSALWSSRDPIPAMVDVLPALRRFFGSALRAALKRLVPSRLAQAQRRFGFGGVLQYLWLGMQHASGVRRMSVPRPFLPRSVLFVCSGNIMRSALAAAVFQTELHVLGVDEVVVESCGLHADPGTTADPRTLEAAAGAGLDLSGHRAQMMTDSLACSFDAVFAMDRMQELELSRRFPACAAKTYLLGACLRGRPAVDIPDPYLADAVRSQAILAIVRERAADLARLVALDVTRQRAGNPEARGRDASESGAS
jgi:protein-tyrosine-phosphatase/predicted ATP-grasp superfamily ATP-dependent carboligase